MKISKTWRIGQVKTFKDERGFGFIKCWDDSREYFFHISNVKTRPINDPDYVIFMLRKSYNKTGT